MGIWIAPAQAR